MATKSKNGTARRPVKICCVILIPVMLFIFCAGAAGLAALDNVSYDLLLADLSKNDYFYDKYVFNALNRAQNVFWLQGEENIRNMGCLEWRQGEYYNYNYHTDIDEKIQYYELVSSNRANQWNFGSLGDENINGEEAKRMVENAIRQQLGEFYYAKNQLDGTPGLFWLITDGDRRFGNVPADIGADFFKSNPVYCVEETGKASQQSRADDLAYNYNDLPYNYVDYDISSYIAFSADMVNWQNGVWKETQSRTINQLIIILASAAAALALTVILITGAGRKYKDEAGKIHFTAADKLWPDLGFCLLVIWEFIVCYIFYETASEALRYGNQGFIIALCAIPSVLCALPLLGWLVSFAKYCKAGKWWRHTLVYTLIRGIYRGIYVMLKSLWAGSHLTVRVALIGAALFAGMVICFGFALTGAAWFGLFLCFAFSAFAVFLLLLYARKIQTLDLGAKAASGGRYETPIAVTGGELGSIAASINNISDGINAAVAERLKSERLKTELITNISHDIRTPLTSLITYTDLLRSEGLNNEKAPEYLEILIQKSARLKTLTDDLFEASKAASGNIDVHPENLDLADFVRQVLGELDERVRESGLDFRLNLPEHAPVRADGKLLWRVTENLLSNVLKYALPGSRVYIDIVPEDRSYRLDMKNISEHPLNIEPSELTERFKRGDDARSGEGSGLGLSIAQSFVLSQGGRFTLSIDGDLFKASVYLPESQRR